MNCMEPCPEWEFEELRWSGTPCNIYKDERILNYDYNRGFKNFKIKTIFQQNAIIKLYKREKEKK